MQNDREKALEARHSRLSKNMHRSQPGSYPSRSPANKIIITTTALVVLLLVAFLWLRPSGAAADEQLAKAAAANRHAVGLVVVSGIIDGETVSVPLATAWAFAPDRFATNAHVVEQARSLAAEGLHLHIVINGQGNRRYRISQSAIHPYFSRQVASEADAIAYDVGIFTIDGSTRDFFRIASSRELQKLDSGYRVGTLGFPMENLLGGGVDHRNPVANMQSGIITSVSGFDQTNRNFAQNQLVRHNLGIAGGSSGSPLFNGNGEVVGIVSAGNMVFQIIGVSDSGEPEIMRTPSAAMINFAQRVDLLQGLEQSLSPIRQQGNNTRRSSGIYVAP